MKPNLDNLKQITLTDVENSLTLPKSWWAVISSLPLARRLILIIVRYTKLTPNQVTFISILLSMLSAALFYKAEFLYGAIFYWLSYVFDCVDGSVARLTSKFSQLGHVLDHSFDRIRTFLCLLAILFNNGIIHSELVLPLFLYYFSNSFLIYINRIYLDIRNIKINHKKDYRKKNIYLNKKILSKNFTKYRITNYLINILSKRKINLFPTDVEGDALIFIFGSITKDIDLFCYISSTLLLIASLLTIYKSIKI